VVQLIGQIDCSEAAGMKETLNRE